VYLNELDTTATKFTLQFLTAKLAASMYHSVDCGVPVLVGDVTTSTSPLCMTAMSPTMPVIWPLPVALVMSHHGVRGWSPLLVKVRL
jgi:hypothetical protein